tara:strand:+ start:484 stop:594 length:111 start_codon:yes stop_codon:yes gene_type:complete
VSGDTTGENTTERMKKRDSNRERYPLLVLDGVYFFR